MPRRGGRGNNRRNDGDRNNYLDDRDSFQERSHDFSDNRKQRPRVSFKLISNRSNKPGKAAMKKLLDDDIDMSEQCVNTNFRGGAGRGAPRDPKRFHPPGSRQNQAKKKLTPGLSPWYQITIPYGQKHEKNFLLKALLTSMAPDIFIPHHYSVMGNAAVFYVDDFAIAEKLLNTDRKITMPDGFRLIIKVKPGTPHVTIDNNLLEKMKQGMASRYIPATKALDLSKFHTDPALIDAFCPLFRPTVMLAALNLISENIPDLVALNLNDNKLQSIDHNIARKLPNLKILYLANNRIIHMNMLESLKDLPIEELYLEGNPLIERYKEKDSYISEVRKRCTKLLKLDGNELPPVIGFDVSDEVNIPTSQSSFLCNVGGQEIVQQFLQQYFALYDSDSRQPLLDAYHENATFSMSVHVGQNNSGRGLHKNYIHLSRNLLRLEGEQRKRNLKCGRLQVVSFLNDLPKTQHCPQSFTVDLTIFTPTLMLLTVNGLFKELSDEASNSKSNITVRSFHKTMIIVPYGAGFCIQNDILTITNATKAQEDKFFKNLPTETIAPVAAQPPPYQTPVVQQQDTVGNVPTPEMKQQLVTTIAMQTNMNLEWSTNCLEQTNWDLNRAMLVFTQLHKQRNIPPEAFIKT